MLGRGTGQSGRALVLVVAAGVVPDGVDLEARLGRQQEPADQQQRGGLRTAMSTCQDTQSGRSQSCVESGCIALQSRPGQSLPESLGSCEDVRSSWKQAVDIARHTGRARGRAAAAGRAGILKTEHLGFKRPKTDRAGAAAADDGQGQDVEHEEHRAVDLQNEQADRVRWA